MLYSLYLIGEALFTGGFLYCVLFLTPTTLTNLCAATALALATLCCLSGLHDLWDGLRKNWSIWRPSTDTTEDFKATANQETRTVGFEAVPLALKCISCVAGYASIIVMLTWAPIKLFPYAHTMSFWPGVSALIEGIVSLFAAAPVFLKSRLVSSGNAIALLEIVDSAIINFTRSSSPNFEPILLSFKKNIRTYSLSVQGYWTRYKSIIWPVWQEPDFRNVWIILWTLCAITVIILYRTLIGRKKLTHLLALLSGALVAGLLDYPSVLREIQAVEAAAYGASNVVRLESIAYRLNLIQMACNCVDRSLVTLGITTWIIISLIIMALPSGHHLMICFSRKGQEKFPGGLVNNKRLVGPAHLTSNVGGARYSKRSDQPREGISENVGSLNEATVAENH